MIRLAANLKWLFGERPLLDRFAAAADIGFTAVELSLPYDIDPALIRRQLDTHRLRYVYLLAPAGDWERGERGLAAIPGREQAFRDGMRRALDYALALGCPLIHVSAGLVPGDASRSRCEALFLENLAFAAGMAAPHGITIGIEPLNARAYPTFLLQTVDQAADIIGRLGLSNVGIVFDFNHVQMASGALCRQIDRHLPLIAHMQIANAPTRSEPGDGEIAFDYVLETIDRSPYAGWIGCEYTPRSDTAASLRWARRYGLHAP